MNHHHHHHHHRRQGRGAAPGTRAGNIRALVSGEQRHAPPLPCPYPGPRPSPRLLQSSPCLGVVVFLALFLHRLLLGVAAQSVPYLAYDPPQSPSRSVPLPPPSYSTRLFPSAAGPYGLNVLLSVRLGDPDDPRTRIRVLLDTGSADLVVLANRVQYPYANSSQQVRADFGEHTLVVDGVAKKFVRSRVYREDFALGSPTQAPSASSPPTRSPTLESNSHNGTTAPPAPRYPAIIANTGFLLSDALRLDENQLQPENSTWPDLHDWSAIQGLIGLAFPWSSAAYTMTQSIITTEDAVPRSALAAARMIVLNISRLSEESYLHVGGVPADLQPMLAWAEPQPVRRRDFRHHGMPVYHLSVCNVDVFAASETSHLFALVDTGAVCLTLPSIAVDVIMAWVPAECAQDQPYCLVPESVQDVAELPALSFRLSEVGPPLYLPLSDLVFDLKPDADGTVRKAYCILADEGPNTVFRVSFGTMALRSLISVLDWDAGQVAFVQKSTHLPRRDALPSNRQLASAEDGTRRAAANVDIGLQHCKARARCAGEQTLSRLNYCENPSCDKYYFREMDPASFTCVYSVGFQLLVFIPLMLCVVGDLSMFRLHVRATKRMRRRLNLHRPHAARTAQAP